MMRYLFVAIFTALLLGAVAPQDAASNKRDDGFAAVSPTYALRFPADYGTHPGHRIEWWYITANLCDGEGQPMGLQWTLFRTGLRPGVADETWSTRSFWMAHAAVTTANRHAFAERFARAGTGQAGVTLDGAFSAWLDDWQLSGDTRPGGAGLRLSASGDDFSYDIRLDVTAGPVLHGDEGYSRKSDDGAASHYFSNVALVVSGTVTLDGKERSVTGRAWLDREWSSALLSRDQTGWDWFALRLGDGTNLMAFQVRSESGRPFRSATWIADNQATPLDGAALDIQKLDGDHRFRVVIQDRGVDIIVTPINPESLMKTRFPYFEGPVRFSGTHEGVGYLERTGIEK